MYKVDFQLGGGYVYQWDCAVLMALNYLGEPVAYSPTIHDLITNFLGEVTGIHLEGEDREHHVELEDINLVTSDRRILIQVKTKQDEAGRWTPSDPLLLKAMYRFYESPYLNDQPETTRFVFLTNRQFNDGLVKLKEAIQGDQLRQSEDAKELFRRLQNYAKHETKDPVDEQRFWQMLKRTTLEQYLLETAVRANIQAKLQAFGYRDWEQAQATLSDHFARDSPFNRAGARLPVSRSRVAGEPTWSQPPDAWEDRSPGSVPATPGQ